MNEWNNYLKKIPKNVLCGMLNRGIYKKHARSFASWLASYKLYCHKTHSFMIMTPKMSFMLLRALFVPAPISPDPK